MDIGELAEQANKEHRLCEGAAKACGEAMSRALMHGLNAGAALAEAKSRCEHGAWGTWVDENFEGGRRIAQMYKRLHDHRPEIEAKAKSVSHLSLTGALKAISAPRAKATEMVTDFADASGATPPRTEDVPGAKDPAHRVAEADAVDEDLVDAVPADVANAYYPEARREEPRSAIEQLQEHPEGARELARLNAEHAAGQARNRVRSRISDLSWLLREVTPEEFAQEVFAEAAGEEVKNALMGSSSKGLNAYAIYAIKPAQEVHDWLGRFLDCLERLHKEAGRRLSELKDLQD